MMKAISTNTIGSISFVTALLTVGLLSHGPFRSDISLTAIANGSLQAGYEDQFEKSNPLQNVAISTVATIKYFGFGQASKGAIVGDDGWLFTEEEFETQPNSAANIELAASRIADVYQQLKSQGVQLLPVIVPDKAEVYQEFVRHRRSERVATRRSLLTTHLKTLSVPFLDPTASLLSAKSAGEVFLRDDTHWTTLGSQVVANEIALKLASLPYTRTEVTTKRLSSSNYNGDLLNFAPTGIFRPIVGPVQQTIEKYETNVVSSGGLFGDAPVDVVLVGTSFSALEDFHFAGFLQSALQSEVLNFAEIGQGPFAPMGRFLKSETYQSTPPIVVVWEIPARYTSKEFTK